VCLFQVVMLLLPLQPKQLFVAVTAKRCFTPKNQVLVILPEPGFFRTKKLIFLIFRLRLKWIVSMSNRPSSHNKGLYALEL
jgi:hypothetical protein